MRWDERRCHAANIRVRRVRLVSVYMADQQAQKKAMERRHTTINATHCVRSSIVVSAIVLVISCRSVLLTMMRHMACVGCILIVVRVRRSRVGLMHRSSRRDEKKNLDSGLSERENFTEE